MLRTSPFLLPFLLSVSACDGGAPIDTAEPAGDSGDADTDTGDTAMDSGDTASDLISAPFCVTSFSASVRSGPNAGLELPGVLVTVDDDSSISGSFLGTGGAPLPVPVTLEGDKITLAFNVEAGTILGTGTTESSVEGCTGVMLGDLTGPAEGDIGDWAGTSALEVPIPADKVPTEPGSPACMYDVSLGDAGKGVIAMGEDSKGMVFGMFVPAGNTALGGVVGAMTDKTFDGALQAKDGTAKPFSLTMDMDPKGCGGAVTGTMEGGSKVDGAAQKLPVPGEFKADNAVMQPAFKPPAQPPTPMMITVPVQKPEK